MIVNDKCSVELDNSQRVCVAATTAPSGHDDDAVALLTPSVVGGHIERLLNASLHVHHPLVTGVEASRLRLLNKHWEHTAPQVHLTRSYVVASHSQNGASWSVLGDQMSRTSQ